MSARVRAAFAELAAALADVPDRAEALGPHVMVGASDCELCGEGVCHYLHLDPAPTWTPLDAAIARGLANRGPLTDAERAEAALMVDAPRRQP